MVVLQFDLEPWLHFGKGTGKVLSKGCVKRATSTALQPEERLAHGHRAL